MKTAGMIDEAPRPFPGGTNARDRARFREDALHFTRHVRGRFGLTVEPAAAGSHSVYFGNAFVRVRVYCGDTRDPWAFAAITIPPDHPAVVPADTEDLREIELHDYARRLGVREQYFLAGRRDRPAGRESYGHAGTPLQVLELAAFLGSRCGPLLAGDPAEIAAVLAWRRRRKWEYLKTIPVVGGGTAADGRPEPPEPPPPAAP